MPEPPAQYRNNNCDVPLMCLTYVNDIMQFKFGYLLKRVLIFTVIFFTKNNLSYKFYYIYFIKENYFRTQLLNLMQVIR